MTTKERLEAQIEQQQRRILELECSNAQKDSRNSQLQRLVDRLTRKIAKLEAAQSPRAQAERVFR